MNNIKNLRAKKSYEIKCIVPIASDTLYFIRFLFKNVSLQSISSRELFVQNIKPMFSFRTYSKTAWINV